MSTLPSQLAGGLCSPARLCTALHSPAQPWQACSFRLCPPAASHGHAFTPPTQVGFTHSAIYKLPEGVVAFFVKPTLVYLYGVDKALVTGAAAALRAVRPPNDYTGNGVLMLGEEVKLRQRAGSK